MNQSINNILVPNTRIIKKDSNIKISEEKVIIGAELLNNLESTNQNNDASNETQLASELVTINGETLDENDEPTIIIDKENGRITKIKVMCSCGRHAQLECEYSKEEENLLHD